MFKIIQRYLAANFIAPFILSTLFFVAFLLTFQLFRLVRLMTNGEVEMTVILEMMGHISVSFLPMAVPLSALFATILTMNKLSEDSEVVAMRSFGLKKLELFTPFLILGLLIAVNIFVLNAKLIPHSKRLFKNTIIQLSSKGMLTDIKAGQFFTDIPKVTLFAERVENNGQDLEDIFIRIEKDGEEQVIFASKGKMIKEVLSEIRTPNLRLALSDGNIVKTNKERNQTEKIIFKEYDFPVLNGGNLPGFVTKDSMRSNSDLRKVIRKRRRKIKENSNARDLRSLSKSELEYWGRINTPLQVLVFIFLGFSLGIKKGRGRSRNSGTAGLIVLIAYYTLFFTGVSLARKGLISSAAVVAIPTTLAFFAGIYYFKKIDWFS